MCFIWRGACINHVSNFYAPFFYSSKWSQFLHMVFAFTENNICKTALFFLAASFPKKAFVFRNNRISEVRVCLQGWFMKNCAFACVFLQKRTTKQRNKLRGNVFPLSPTSHQKSLYLPKRKPSNSAKYFQTVLWRLYSITDACHPPKAL